MRAAAAGIGGGAGGAPRNRSAPNYRLHEVIGRGSFGAVYRAVHAETGRAYAVKCIRVMFASHYHKVCAINELRILASHTCPFLVAFKEAYVLDGALHIVTEWARRGDLAALLRRRRTQQQRLSETEVWHYFLQLCCGVNYLHHINVIHRDLKPANVLIDDQQNVKLADMGIVKITTNLPNAHAQTQVGTPYYMSPEIFRRERYGPGSDVWALGCILYELMLLHPPFEAPTMHALREKIFGGNVRVAPPALYTDDLRRLTRMLMHVQPRARPTLRSVLAEPRVAGEMALRGLTALTSGAAEVKALFDVKCAVPRRVEEWVRVSQLFRDLNATISLDGSMKQRMAAVEQLRVQLQSGHADRLRLQKLYDAAVRRLRGAREEVERLEGVAQSLAAKLGLDQVDLGV